MLFARVEQKILLSISLIIIFALLSILSTQVFSAPNLESQQRSFSIEIQSDSPILIRDLFVTILPIGKKRATPSMEVIFYLENRSKQNIKSYAFQDPAEDGSDYKDYEERGSGGNILAGASERTKLIMNIEGKTIVYRIKRVTFEDGTEWRATPFDSVKAQKSTRLTAQSKDANNAENQEQSVKRAIKSEWQSAPIFTDRVTKIIEASSVMIDKIEVQTKLHEIRLERLDVVESCDSKRNKANATDKGLDFDVEKFKSYGYKGKIFAYEIDYSLIEAEDQYEIGATITQIYFDDEGNGTFKLRCGVSELESLPNWIKTLAKKK